MRRDVSIQMAIILLMLSMLSLKNQHNGLILMEMVLVMYSKDLEEISVSVLLVVHSKIEMVA